MIRQLAETSKKEAMQRIRDEVLSCRRCGLCDGRRNPVIGEGNLDAKVVFVGEAPGRREDETGRPFVGSAGQLLERLLGSIGLHREDVYIANIVKCRPPNNRPPTPREIEACSPHLERQLEIIRPKIIAPMGNTAIGYMTSRLGLKPVRISAMHGRAIEAEAPWGRVVLFPLYHPAAALYTKELEKIMERDFAALGRLLDEIDGPTAAAP
jgi:DNA polymerase